MTMLPYLYRIDYQPPQSREKKTYRLSLQETSKKFTRRNTFPFDNHSTSNKYANSTEKDFAVPLPSREVSVCSWYDGEVKQSLYRNTPCTVATSRSPSPSPSKPFHGHLQTKAHNYAKLPVWVEAIRSWVPAKRKPQSYQTFIRHIKLAYRNRDMFRDPCPYLPRCKHARTLSALDRQRQKIKELEERRHKERFLKLLERFGKIQEHWEQIRHKSDVIGAEHQARLNAFKKTIDHYKDPSEYIKKKRVEREEIERELQTKREAARKAKLEKMRRKIPRIIITQYKDPAGENISEQESVESTGKEKIPIPAMPNWSDIESEIEDLQENQQDSMECDGHPDAVQITSTVDNKTETINPPELFNENKIESADGSVDDRASLASNSLSQLAPPDLSSLNPSDDSSLLDKITSADDTDILMSTMAPIPFGVANGVILDKAITASSFLDRYHVPNQARLNNTRKRRSKNAGTWCPKISDRKQFLQVDLGSTGIVKQIATQGYAASGNVTAMDKRWVTSYSLAFSEDGSKWTNHTENTTIKVFQGNTDNNSVVLNSLDQPVQARYVRILPMTWKNGIALRMEIFGNFTEEALVTPVVEARDAPGSGASGEKSFHTQSPPPSEPKTPSPEPNKPTPRQEEPVFMAESCSEGLVLARTEFKVTEEKNEVEEDSGDVWDSDVVEEVDTDIARETEEVMVMEDSLPLSNLKILGEQTSSRVKQKSNKAKTEEKVKNKKMKKRKKKKIAVTFTNDMDDLVEEVEENSRTPTPEQPEPEIEVEQEEVPIFVVPPLPELRPKESKKKTAKSTRKFSMFEANKNSPEAEDMKKLLSQATANDSIQKELRRQELAEDRRKKFDDFLKSRPKAESIASSFSPSSTRSTSTMGNFITKYCILSEGQVNYYQRVFNSFDDDEDGFLFPEELLDALEYVNSNLLSDSHLHYIFRILELCDCSLDSGVDLKFFSVIVAFSQRIAALDEFAKILIPKLDFKELDYKLQRAKSLFMCYADEETKTMPLEHLTLGLLAGGLTDNQMKDVMGTLGQTTHLDFFDFLSYIPLFLHIHDNILNNPLGGVT